LIYNLKLKLYILITLDYFAELLTDFSYTNFTVGLSYADALDRLRVHLNIILFSTVIIEIMIRLKAKMVTIMPTLLIQLLLLLLLLLILI